MTSRVAIAYLTKDRVDFSSQTLPRILDEAEGNFDLYWLDGSVTKEGREFPYEIAAQWRNTHDGKYPIKELHGNVGGGSAAAIQNAFMYLTGKDYDYVGLIENDVLLEKGWFEKTMGLFDTRVVTDSKILGTTSDGHIAMTEVETGKLRVGAVSARCFKHRILDNQDSFAVMADVGAGMVIFKKQFINDILLNWRRPALWELQALCKHFSGYDYPIPKMVTEQDPNIEKQWVMSEDWFWPIILMSKGYATLACTPSMAINLDDPDGERDPVER